MGTLYDAIFSGMRYYADKQNWNLTNEILHDEESLNAIFQEKSVFPTNFNFLELKSTSELLIEGEVEESSINKIQIWQDLKEIFTLLGLYPYTTDLPEDDDDTRELLGY